MNRTILLPICALLAALTLACGGDSEELRKQYASALEAYRANDIATATERFRDLYNDHPDFESTRLYYGRTLFYSREYTRAAEVFEEAVDAVPGNADAMFWHAKALAQKPETLQSALNTLEALLALNSSHIGGWHLKGMIHEQRKEIEPAISAYRAATAEESKLALVHLRLATLYRDASLVPQARAEFARARLLARDDRTLLALIAEAERAPAGGTPPPAAQPATPTTP